MRTRGLWVLVLAASLAGNVLLWRASKRAEEAARSAESRARDAERRVAAATGRGVFLTQDEIALLKHAGLTEPVDQLRSDLEAHGSVLPMKGVMGGKMGFYDRDGVILLPGRYVYAPAEDGHYLVHAVLRYDVEPGGKIRWRLLDASRD
jgi:hypothetical protein